MKMTVARSFNTAGAVTSTAGLSDVLFSDSAGASDGEPSGDSIGGAGGEETGVGASAAGERLGEAAGVGEGDDTGSGAGHVVHTSPDKNSLRQFPGPCFRLFSMALICSHV